MKQIVYICVFLLCSMSCYEDFGNYDYNRLPEIIIEGIERDFGAKQLFVDSLIIKPKISFGEEDESSFETTWYNSKDGKLDTITHNSELRLLMNEAGVINYIFEIVHKELGLSKRVFTKVFVASEMQRGFYILKETADANTDMDGFIRLGEDEYNYLPNLITEKMGEPLLGKPIDLDYWDWQYNDFEKGEITTERVLRPASEKDIAIFRMTDFDYIGGMDELFFDVGKGDLKIEGIKSINGTTLIFYNDGRLRTMPNTVVSRFQLELNGAYELEPMMCSSSKQNMYVYDKLKSSFYVIGSASIALHTSPDINSDKKYMPMNNWDADLRFFGRGQGNLPPTNMNAGIGYALLQKKKDPDSLFLVHISLNSASVGGAGNFSDIGQIDTLPTGLALKRGELYAMHEYEKLLFFSIGNRVFSYNLMTQKEDLVIGESDFPEENGLPDEITYLRYIRNNYDGGEYRFDRLFVGGYKDGHYTLYAYNLVAGKPVGTPLMWSGEGKIKKIVYAAPTTNVTPFYIYQ